MSVGIGGTIMESHRERRRFWRGWRRLPDVRGLLDLALCRKPLRVIDRVRVDEVSWIGTGTEPLAARRVAR